MTSPSNLEQVRAAAIDGRTENVRYRQNELQKLHSSLRENTSTILSSIAKDANGGSPAISFESEAEYWLTMNAVERQYESLDFEASIKQEYLITTGINNKDRRIGKGLVAMRPTTHTRFYSIIVPLATAIAAGNCLVLEFVETVLNVDLVLKELLLKALDPDTFCILDTTIPNSSNIFLVDQTTSSTASSANRLCSNPAMRAIAIVDRAADIEAAAKAIVTARFSFRGTSPYSPDLVIVNEYIKNEFAEECSRYAAKFFSSASKNMGAQNKKFIEAEKALKEAEEKGQVSTSGSGSFKVVDIHDRTCPIASTKISGYYLPIIKSTSLMDSLKISKSLDSEPLALYTFSDLATAKFISQHINAIVSYANLIPLHLLVGPAAPNTALSPASHHRYTVDMFSSPRPQYIASPPAPDNFSLINDILGGFHEPEMQVLALQKLREGMVGSGENGGKVLRPRKAQPKGHQLGFFEQGILLGAGLVLTVVISTVSCGIWVLRRSM